MEEESEVPAASADSPQDQLLWTPDEVFVWFKKKFDVDLSPGKHFKHDAGETLVCLAWGHPFAAFSVKCRVVAGNTGKTNVRYLCRLCAQGKDLFRRVKAWKAGNNTAFQLHMERYHKEVMKEEELKAALRPYKQPKELRVKKELRQAAVQSKDNGTTGVLELLQPGPALPDSDGLMDQEEAADGNAVETVSEKSFGEGQHGSSEIGLSQASLQASFTATKAERTEVGMEAEDTKRRKTAPNNSLTYFNSDGLVLDASRTEAKRQEAESRTACPQCREEVKRDELEAHLRDELRYYPVRCTICRAHFVDWPNGEAHYQGRFSRHGGVGPELTEVRDWEKERRLEELLKRAEL